MFPPFAFPLVRRAAFPAVSVIDPPTAAPAEDVPAVAFDADSEAALPTVLAAAAAGVPADKESAVEAVDATLPVRPESAVISEFAPLAA